jgi:hypothetical protein
MTSSMSLRRLLVASFVASFAAGCEWGHPDTFETGKVTLLDLDTHTVEQISGVRVELYSNSDSMSVAVHTDGTLNFPKASAGSYWIHASKPGYTMAATSVQYGVDDYPIESISLRIFEIPMMAPMLDSVRQDSTALHMFATYKPRSGEGLAFVCKDPSPDSAARPLFRASYDRMHESWKATISGRQTAGKLVGSVIYNYEFDSATGSFIDASGPGSNMILIK